MRNAHGAQYRYTAVYGAFRIVRTGKTNCFHRALFINMYRRVRLRKYSVLDFYILTVTRRRDRVRIKNEWIVVIFVDSVSDEIRTKPGTRSRRNIIIKRH